MKDLMKLDLYDLLNIKSNASEAEIKKAYRKKALACHPDKNPGNPKALEDFKQLRKAVEILTHTVTRREYDKILRERKLENAKRIFDRSSNERDFPNRKLPKMSVPRWPPSFSYTTSKNEQAFYPNPRKDFLHRRDRPVPTWPPSASKTPPKRENVFRPYSNYKHFYSSIIKPATFIPPPTPKDLSNNQFGSFSNNKFQNATFSTPSSNDTSSDSSWKPSSILKPATFIPPSNS
ncbi:hypothetical protein JTE90_007160 [Oedothorax gibbosus]|uniref:J domain-containing protein n=1 Tax=Oedothorax gibbosus TaxID=931172 RepID=A0AAV6UXK0_9ARAC|nr:hypothetical protein JTE90_007160 [Oedothorax gibbosus]